MANLLCRIYYKSEDKMKIHSPNAHKKAAVQKSDFFYNYFTMGFVSWDYFYMSAWVQFNNLTM